MEKDFGVAEVGSLSQVNEVEWTIEGRGKRGDGGRAKDEVEGKNKKRRDQPERDEEDQKKGRWMKGRKEGRKEG